MDIAKHEVESNDLARLIIEAAPQGMLIADDLGQIVSVNSQVEAWFGYSRDELVGSPVDVLVPDAQQAAHKHHRARFNARKTPRPMGQGQELFGRRRDGSEFPVDVSLHPIETDTGVMVLANIVDATHSRKADADRRQELAHTQNRLVQSERLAAIGQMVTGLAHESRNALQRARGCLDLLELDLEEQPQQLLLIARIRDALADLNRHYEEVKHYAAPIVLRRSEIDLFDLCREAFDDLACEFSGGDHNLVILGHDEVAKCRADAHRIKQLLRNLFENAMTADSRGAVMQVRAESVRWNQSPAVRLMVEDQSGGIDESIIETMFEPFYTTKQHGTGLGLAICERIVSAHNGSIEAHNNQQGGLTVEVLLPR